jgi:hypothetical protein
VTLNLPAVLVVAAALLGAGCATIQRYQVGDTERMLAAAGFQRHPSDAPARQEDLRSMPPYQIASRTKDDGAIVYTYADPDECRCVYVGGSEEYSRYERLRARREATQRSAGNAGGAP